MPVRLIPCRRKDDHSVTHMIGATALFHFPDWEPIPDEPAEQPEGTGAASTPEPGEPVDPAESEPSTTRKSRSRAASTDKE